MSRTRFFAALVGLLTAFTLAAPSTATADTQQTLVRTIYYDSSRAAELTSTVEDAVKIWNAGVTSVKLVKGSGGITITTAQNGSAPGTASCVGCTRGQIYFYRNQITSSGASSLRVVVHEFGHILSLNHPSDIGNCAKVMAGGRCQNAQPSSAELAAVQRFWTGRIAAPAPAPHEHAVFA
ncbi:snapalysin family zinc-dependent metalloprotease [Actinokineospora diospyrosa]|uniref:Extracellular small neutral protease n=1 Tax=Actinokineospora diospyrosa TaxID=103728 RepID=A0ABT1IK70_9PSEU|nr:snapalysin family zinc-dependent metalloprotease [Actinokineospora diospyrosa]MCP2273043.1 snapalysin [Actinokineospora diospyrosa]